MGNRAQRFTLPPRPCLQQSDQCLALSLSSTLAGVFGTDMAISRPLVIRAMTVVVLAATLLLGACASDPDRDDIIDALQKGGLDRPVAECVADAFAELPEEDRKLIAQRG